MNLLKHIAKHLYAQHGANLGDYCLVFPGRRASMFFAAYLSQEIKESVWAPDFYTVSDFFESVSGVQQSDNLGLLFDLYEVWKQEKKSNESFDDFYFWGEMLLNDFDDIDKYLVNAADLFQNLLAIKDLEGHFDYLNDDKVLLEFIQKFWDGIRVSKSSEEKDSFVQVWEILNKVYLSFRKALSKKGLAYEGMMYRDVAQEILAGNTPEFAHEKYIFIGFNALNRCEEVVFDYLRKANKAEFYWDYDEYYIKEKGHEAGYFIRENIKRYPMPENFSFPFSTFTEKRKIKLYSSSSESGQAKLAPRILDEILDDKKDQRHVALVLGDEKLLLPVLHSLSPKVKEINVTMGFPLYNTPISSFAEQVLQLQKNVRKRKDESYFYFKDVLALLSHQYIVSVWAEEAEKLKKNIMQRNQVLVPVSQFAQSETFSRLFRRVNEYVDYSEYLLQVFYLLYKGLEKKEGETLNFDLDKEFIYQAYLSINRLKGILAGQQEIIKLDTYIRLFRRIIKGLTIPFVGEPLTGLQVMGILETRALDFEDVVMLSVNEGVVPKASASSSFIPYNLRKGFGLPTIEHQDAIFAYYFYRLVQRTKNLHIVYHTRSDGMNVGEKSRYLFQMEYEGLADIEHCSLQSDAYADVPAEITVFKDEMVMKKLFEYTQKDRRSFSASAINTFLDCSLKFYYRYMLGLKEPELVSEEIDPALFGTILHKSMEIIYSPWVGKEISAEQISFLSKDKTLHHQAIQEAFQKEYFQSDKPMEMEGQNQVVFNVIEEYVKIILQYDMQIAPLKIVGLEQKCQFNFPVEVNGELKHINFAGTIDRVDEHKGFVRIVDYKTGGSTEQAFKTIESIYDREEKYRSSVAFQTLFYSKLYQSMQDDLPITPVVYAVRKLHQKNNSVLLEYDKSPLVRFQQVAEEFDQGLSQVIQDLFDKHQPFEQTPDIKQCTYCPYAGICKR